MSADSKVFRGWPAEALEFCEGLEAGNSKAYWTARKNVYETVVLSAMKAILAELAPSSETARYSVPIGTPASAPAGLRTRLTSEPSSVPAIGTAG
jgi:hypothetical protein